MNSINTLTAQIEKQLHDSPRTDTRRQIAAALIVDHQTEVARLVPLAVVDFYPATPTTPAKPTTTTGRRSNG